MGDTPILDALWNYMSENNAPFSMPGNKAGRGFVDETKGEKLRNILLRGDITEVEGLDNLHSPEGIIRDAEELLGRLYGSKKSYFLVNGSTSGNLAMIFSAFNEGDKVLVERNCHRSISNGIILRKLQPVYIRNYISKKYNAPISIDMEHFLRILEMNNDVKGIILTYPNYYGIAGDLSCIIDKCRSKGVKVLVDCAHGAHFGITKDFPENPLSLGANMVVMSAHKTLPSLTQTAYLHIDDSIEEKTVDFYVSAFTSTSPSYLLMASMDYARAYLEEKGEIAFKNCLSVSESYKKRINLLRHFHVIDEVDIKREMTNFNIKMDPLRMVINVEMGYNAHGILDYLRYKGVQCEMSDGFNLILIISPFNTEEDFEKLYNALLTCPIDDYRCKVFDIMSGNHTPKREYLPYELQKMTAEKVKLEESIGRVCADNIVPYPPGVPLIIMGEIMDTKTLDMIQYYLNNDVTILGLQKGYINVVKK